MTDTMLFKEHLDELQASLDAVYSMWVMGKLDCPQMEEVLDNIRMHAREMYYCKEVG